MAPFIWRARTIIYVCELQAPQEPLPSSGEPSRRAAGRLAAPMTGAHATASHSPAAVAAAAGAEPSGVELLRFSLEGNALGLRAAVDGISAVQRDLLR